MKSQRRRTKKRRRKKESYEYSAKFILTLFTRRQEPILKGPIPRKLIKIIHDLFKELKITPGRLKIEKKYIIINFTTHNPDIS